MLALSCASVSLAAFQEQTSMFSSHDARVTTKAIFPTPSWSVSMLHLTKVSESCYPWVFLKMSWDVRNIPRPLGHTIIQKRRVKIMWIDTQSDLRGIAFSFDDTTNKDQGSSLFSDLSSCLHRHYRRQSCNHMFLGFLSGRQQQDVINVHYTQTKLKFMTILHNLSTIHTRFQRIRPKAYMFNRKCQKLQPCQWSIT